MDETAAPRSALGGLYLRKGDIHKAIPALERCLALAQARHHPYWFPLIASALGPAYALSGRLAEAVPLLEQAVERAASMRIMGSHSLRLAGLSEAYLLAGRTDEAVEQARHALDLSQHYKERGHQAWALHLFGEIGARCDSPDVERAEASYRQALALAEELRMRPLLAHCHLGLGTLYRQIGWLE